MCFFAMLLNVIILQMNIYILYGQNNMQSIPHMFLCVSQYKILWKQNYIITDSILTQTHRVKNI